MSIFDGILSQISGHSDIANLAEKLGIDKDMAEKAIAALGSAHQKQGDTVELAASSTGLSSVILRQIVEQIGGEGSLGEFARMIQDDPSKVSAFFDRDGDGSALDDAADFANGLFGKK
ncbi:hypothetical protein B2G71_07610 [Novosphingobium sp. PC22D]|uniref:hypothetical protein n=1 Tax=Novosphingobium sp. PC22D TaxID=1962403 RepID=UPI000BEFB0A7|nr:hypothetical protein [Novosphingobium sp. PC22D]PEQ13294.1 hypothetical protein B2G71_07610 [Novosphingobium sp. PC22D]